MSGLKWKKDGTAKCGAFNFSILYTDYLGPQWDLKFTILSSGMYLESNFKTEAAAKRAAESWLRKQAKAMLADLGGGK